ncbi:DUF4345 family protein [Sandarakinorhabdus sp.]|uniref:DUF4345 family protein n=1 Tax=Sandarakinorhabdus sp. TaxID=1916663 RepID=UPI00286D78F8|nr:DUF4345 family protein [Sandarakinorhabdus sp.]
MAMALRGLVALIGLFNILIGLGFLMRPAQLAQQFFLSPVGSQGLATLRADFPGFFITGGTFALIGALRSDTRALLVPMLLLAVALVGRFVSLAADGFGPEAVQPMVAEAVMILVLFLCQRSLGRAK